VSSKNRKIDTLQNDTNAESPVYVTIKTRLKDRKTGKISASEMPRFKRKLLALLCFALLCFALLCFALLCFAYSMEDT
jgi:hypothetical protein